ncbi:hypothetical protein FWH09_02325 [Candidatus Saccharibacteria bacterium]|nr:hypothetical protein [Candidatus Saccharibacteria bacterium]
MDRDNDRTSGNSKKFSARAIHNRNMQNNNSRRGVASDEVFDAIPDHEESARSFVEEEDNASYEEDRPDYRDNTRYENNKPKGGGMKGVLIALVAIIAVVVIGILIWSAVKEDEATDGNTGGAGSGQEESNVNNGSNNNHNNNGPSNGNNNGSGNNNNGSGNNNGGSSGNNGGGTGNITPGPMEDTIDSIIEAFTNSTFFEENPARYEFSGLQINNGQTEGFRNATVAIMPTEGASFVGMFYRTPTLGWQWFAAAEQQTTPCTNFNTNDLRNAFFGQPCLDASGNTTTVQ